MPNMKSKVFVPAVFLILIAIANIVPSFAEAKGGDEQSQIILLNDSASALEDSDPILSKKLSVLADLKQKQWEYHNSHKDAPPDIITDKERLVFREEIKVLTSAAGIIQPTYPSIARDLTRMIKDIKRSMEIDK